MYIYKYRVWPGLAQQNKTKESKKTDVRLIFYKKSYTTQSCFFFSNLISQYYTETMFAIRFISSLEERGIVKRFITILHEISNQRKRKRKEEGGGRHVRRKQNKTNTISHQALLQHLRDHESISYIAYISEGGVGHGMLRSKDSPCRP